MRNVKILTVPDWLDLYLLNVSFQENGATRGKGKNENQIINTITFIQDA